jgi:hypothetical protein
MQACSGGKRIFSGGVCQKLASASSGVRLGWTSQAMQEQEIN